VNVEKTICAKSERRLAAFRMIRDGDRVAVGVSGGKDSLTLLEALLMLQRRRPFISRLRHLPSSKAKFLAPIHQSALSCRERGVDWTYVEDAPSLRLLDEQPGHGCDVCSRFRRRAVYTLAAPPPGQRDCIRSHADDFCESFLRNAMFNGRVKRLASCYVGRASASFV